MHIHDSLQRILQANDRLAMMFYDHFLEKHPEVQPYFARVDFNRQRVLLTTALMVIERYHANPTPAVEQYLQYLGTKHHEMSIPPDTFPKWIVAMLETMARFHGDDWTSDLAEQWRKAIDQAWQLMLQGYEQHITV